MPYVTLIATSDEYDSTLGLLIKGAPRYDGMMCDRNGSMIAHDLIEHQNGYSAIGPIDDELEALGGIWHARGRHGDMMSQTGGAYSPAENVAADISRMFSELGAVGIYWPRVGKYRTKAHLYDGDFFEIIEKARHGIIADYNCGSDEPLDRQLMTAYLENALHLMRSGFNKAGRRFGDSYASNSAYRFILEAVKQTTKFIDYEGQEFRLRWSMDSADCYEIASNEGIY